ncbi:MAG: hypothetical protein JXN59_03595 [Anaerolineae bacterium]|nr:hypothetical protein [Anaerolineae bacterium]
MAKRRKTSSLALDELLFRLVAPVVGVAVGVPLAIVYLVLIGITFVVWAGVAGVTGLGVGLLNFVEVVITAHRDAASDDRPPQWPFITRFYEPQPARLIYMYDAGWFVIRYVFEHLPAVTGDAADNWFAKSQAYRREARRQSGAWGRLFSVWLYGSAAGIYLAAMFHYVAAFFIAGLFALIHSGVLLAGVALTSLMMLVLGLVNALTGAIYHMYYRCPVCHAQMRLPVYTCPRCSRAHTRLWPSVYGVFAHTCLCGEKLPTLDALGRQALTQRCPTCDSVLNAAIGRATNLHIPIVGGPSAGKTHYLIATLRSLIEHYAPAHNLTVSMPDIEHRRDYEASVRILRRGQQLRKTQVERDSNTRAYNLQIKRRWHPVPTLLYIYDGAGEYYTSQESAQQQVYYRYVNGVILIVDPFAIAQVYAQYRPRIDAEGQTLAVNAQEPLSGIYERMLEALEVHYNLKRDTRFPHPIAVVLTKADAFDLDARIGAEAARRLIQRDPAVASEGEAIHRLVEQFLVEFGESNFVRNLRLQFSAVRFFSVSSTGRMVDPADYRSLEPVRVVEPLVWLLAENSALPRETASAPAPVKA